MTFRSLGRLAVLTFALAVPTLTACPAAAAKIKCWTNDEGVRECGNVVPPKYSQRGHEELSKTGITISTQERAKTPEEIEAERRAAEDAARRQAEAEQRAEMQAAKDRVLLDTFTTEDDMVLAHQGRKAAIDSRIKHTRRILQDLEAELRQLEHEAAKQERAGQAVPGELKKRIAEVEAQIANHETSIDESDQEKQALDLQFEKDLARYRKLKSASN